MTVDASTRLSGPHNGNGVTTSFPYDFPITSNTELRVTLRDADGVETVLTLTTHYSVTGVGSENGGNVVFVLAPAAGTKVIIEGVTPKTQTVDYTGNERFPSASHQAGMDKGTRVDQELARDIAQTVRAPYGEAGIVLPAAPDEGYEFLARSDNGSIIGIPSSEIGSGGGGGGGSIADGDKGDLTISGSGSVFALNANVVTNAKFRLSAALSIVGRAGNTTGNVADIAAGTDGHVLRRAGNELGFGQLALGAFADNIITPPKLAFSGAGLAGAASAGAGALITLNATLEFNAGSLRRAALTGDVTSAAGSNATSIANGVITFAMLHSGLVDNDSSMVANSTQRVPSQAAVKAALDAIASGVNDKNPVRIATTANGTLATAFDNGSTVDGETLATGDRILIKNQSTATENGIYVVEASGAPTRTTDADTGAEILGARVLVQEGSVNAGSSWRCTTPGPITLGSTNLTFTQVGQGGSSTLPDGDYGAWAMSAGVATLNNLVVSTGKIADAAVTYAKMQNVAAYSVVGRSTGSSGVAAAIAAAAVGLALMRGVSGLAWELPGFTKPEWFGAVGDGSTDDLAAFQAMHSAISAGTAPRNVRLDRKTYALSATWTVTTALFLQGEGKHGPTAPGMSAIAGSQLKRVGATTTGGAVKFNNINNGLWGARGVTFHAGTVGSPDGPIAQYACVVDGGLGFEFTDCRFYGGTVNSIHCRGTTATLSYGTFERCVADEYSDAPFAWVFDSANDEANPCHILVSNCSVTHGEGPSHTGQGLFIGAPDNITFVQFYAYAPASLHADSYSVVIDPTQITITGLGSFWLPSNIRFFGLEPVGGVHVLSGGSNTVQLGIIWGLANDNSLSGKSGVFNESSMLLPWQDSAGVWHGKPAFHATKGGVDQTAIDHLSAEQVTYGTEVVDTGGYYNHSLSAWTAPTSGWVQFDFSFNVNQNINQDAVCQGRLCENGVEITYSDTNRAMGNNEGTAGKQPLVFVTAGYAYTVKAYIATSGGSNNGVISGDTKSAYFKGAYVS